MKKTTKILMSTQIDGGHIKLCYTLTDRSFPYQLPESTVQVRFMLVEKTLTPNPGANLSSLDVIKSSPPLDSPIFQFEQDDHAQIFMECLRGEQLLYNGIVDWVRSTREPKDGETSTAGPHPANFSCADDRRIQLWENELGFINIVFHRQFHLVAAFIAPSTQVEVEAGADTLRVSGIKIRKLERSPTLDAKEPWRTDGNPAVLKLRFTRSEHVNAFRDAVLRHRDATAMLYPEVAKTIAQSIAHETPEVKVPPPPPPDFRHGRSMSTSAAVPPLPGTLPNSPPQQFPASPQSPSPHQTTFQQYAIGHSQSVRINRPPPLPSFPGQPGAFLPGSINSPRFQNAQPSPMTGTFSPFSISSFPSPPGAVMPYQSPAAVASATVVPQITTMSNQPYYPTTITPMTPGLPSAKFPPPIQTSMVASTQVGGGGIPQPPSTPIREQAPRQGSFANRTETIAENTQFEPVELPASFPDSPESKNEGTKEGGMRRDGSIRSSRGGSGLRREDSVKMFPKDDDVVEEEQPGYNPLGGNVSIPLPPPGSRQAVASEGGKMSRVWKKLK
ncbi:hypothetical protein AA313_de0208280 [Arthrobotrys entomopaga]|nr:hypothetical protein AA313_de0208280 [Arthrobotrys entomopaga]